MKLLCNASYYQLCAFLFLISGSGTYGDVYKVSLLTVSSFTCYLIAANQFYITILFRDWLTCNFTFC